MHIDINYAEPRGKGRRTTAMHKVPLLGQVLPFQGWVSSHGLLLFQLLAPLALIHPSTMEEKYVLKISLRWLLGSHKYTADQCNKSPERSFRKYMCLIADFLSLLVLLTNSVFDHLVGLLPSTKEKNSLQIVREYVGSCRKFTCLFSRCFS